jgi:L-asparaginase
MSDPILVLTTGGTIDKQYFDALSQYQIADTMVTTSCTILPIVRSSYAFVLALCPNAGF